MSIKLRVRYQLKNAINLFSSFQIPTVLTSIMAKLTVTSVVVILIGGYITQIGSLTTSGYEIAALEKQISSLNYETKRLNSELASHQSISSVQKRLNEISMKPVKEIKYLKAEDTSVAQR